MSDTCCTLLNIVKQVSSFNLWDHFLTDILNLRGLRAKRPQLHAYSTVNIFLLNVSAYFLLQQNDFKTGHQQLFRRVIFQRFQDTSPTDTCPKDISPNKHIPDGHFPDQTHPRWTIPQPDKCLTDISPTRDIPDGHFPDQKNPRQTCLTVAASQ